MDTLPTTIRDPDHYNHPWKIKIDELIQELNKWKRKFEETDGIKRGEYDEPELVTFDSVFGKSAYEWQKMDGDGKVQLPANQNKYNIIHDLKDIQGLATYEINDCNKALDSLQQPTNEVNDIMDEEEPYKDSYMQFHEEKTTEEVIYLRKELKKTKKELNQSIQWIKCNKNK